MTFVQPYSALDVAARLRHCLEVGTVDPDLVTDDVGFDGQFPHQLHSLTGAAAIEASLAQEGPGRRFGRWDVAATERGFVAEYAYRTTGEPSLLSVGVAVATLEGDRISRLLVCCAGSWDAATEAEVYARRDLAGAAS